MSSDQVVLSPPHPQLVTQEPLHFLDSPDAPLIKRTEEIISDFQEIVDVYNQPTSPPPTDGLLVRMTAHSRALRDFQSYCFTGIQEMKAYVEENMAQWRNLAQTQAEELNRLKIALEKQNRSRKLETKTLKTVEAQLQAKESALKDAEKDMKQQAKKVGELQKKLTAAHEEIRNREAVVQAHELKIQQLSSQVGVHKKELIEAKKLQPNPQTVAVEKKAFESRVADLNRGLASAQSKAKTEEGKATAARKACQAAVEKQQALARELQDVRQNLEDVRRKAQSDLQAQASSFTGQDERWMERLFRLEQGHSQAKQSLEAQIHDLQDSVQTQSQEIERQHGVIQRQQEQIQNQQEQIQSLRQDLKDANNDRQMLKQMVLDLQEQVKGIEKGIQPFGDEDIADRIRLRNLLDHTQAWLAKKAGLISPSEDQSTDVLSGLWRLSLEPEKFTWARIQSARNLLAGKDLGNTAQAFVDNTDAMQIVCEVKSRFRGGGNETHRPLEPAQYKRSIERFFELNPYDDAQPFLLSMLDYTFA